MTSRHLIGNLFHNFFDSIAKAAIIAPCMLIAAFGCIASPALRCLTAMATHGPNTHVFLLLLTNLFLFLFLFLFL